MRKIRVVAKTENGFRVVGTEWTRQAAQYLADDYMFSLNPDEDECPEIVFEPARVIAGFWH